VAEQVVIIGAGQAGLAVSRYLIGAGVPHVILEQSRVAQTWRGRWDSFCLVTPNWTMALPGMPYEGDDPDGFEPRDEIVRYLERYAASFGAPIQERVEVTSVEAGTGRALRLRTSIGDMQADHVVLATGAYQRPHRPPVAVECPAGVLMIDAEQYTNPSALPPGRVLVVGSGQTGCQLAEDLVLAGREVVLACGRAPWAPRQLDGRDIVTWLEHTTWFDTPLNALPSPAARLVANFQLSGRDGGHDLNYRVLQQMGVELSGRLLAIADGRARFARDLAQSVAFGDARYGDVCRLLREQLPEKGLKVPEMPEPRQFTANQLEEISLAGFGAVVFTCGFRPDYARWVKLPAFDELGFPLAPDGICATVRGLYFVGVHFLRKRRSSLLWGVGEDAEIVARAIISELRLPGISTAISSANRTTRLQRGSH